MPKLKDLKKRIRMMRLRLHRLVDNHGTWHPSVIARSSELDEALNVYYRIRNSRKQAPH